MIASVRDVGRVAIALNHLRGNGRGLQAEPRADALFVLRLQMAEGADGAGELADAHVFGGSIEAGEVALHLGVPVEQLEAECRGLGVDAVRAADGRRVLELDGAALEHCEQRRKPVADERRRLFDLQGLRGVDNVVRREPVVQPAGLGVQPLRFQAFCDGGREGDDVVLHFGLDLLDAIGREAGLRSRWPQQRLAGITPSSASTVLAADSTCSQQRYLFSSVQMRPIAGRV